MILVSLFACLLTISVLNAEVTEKDLEEQLGISVQSAKKVNWKDWVNAQNGPRFPRVEDPECKECIGKVKHSLGYCCDPFEGQSNATGAPTANNTCTKGPNLRCERTVYVCKSGMFPNAAGNDCVKRPTKNLGAKCDEKTDNCHTAFAACINGTCQCKDGFVAKGKTGCKPTEYNCPFGKPYQVNGNIWPCRTDKSNGCPSGHFCIIGKSEEDTVADDDGTEAGTEAGQTSPSGTRPLFLSGSGIDQAYCCPLMPLVKTALFTDICLHGKPLVVDDLDECPIETHYVDRIINPRGVCCPSPCAIDQQYAIIVNGTCTYK